MTHNPPDPLVAETCCRCGIRFAMPRSFNQRCQEDSNVWFYCPSGHRQHYTGEEREREKLRRERDRLKQNAAYLEDRLKGEQEIRERAERSASAFKGQVTRLKNRARAGVCPCCNRTFQNLARHMASQHPDFEAEADAP